MTSAQVSELYERFGYAVHRRCLRILRDPGLAEDALQDVFVRVLRFGDGYRGGSVLAWLLRIADRAALDRLGRARAHGKGVAALAPLGEPPGDAVQAPEASLLLSEVLAQLPRPLPQGALLAYLDGMSQAESAAALGCSTMTVKRRMRALHRRAQELTEAQPDGEVGHVEDPA